MNANKNSAGKKPASSGQQNGANPSRNNLPQAKPPFGGYVPKYTPAPEPTVLPAPEVINNIDIPQTFDVTTLDDIVHRIIDNASVLFPGSKLKVTTVLAPSGLLYHALVLAPKNAERETSRWKVELKGPGIGSEKKADGVGRRKALEALLDEVERRVGKEMLGG